MKSKKSGSNKNRVKKIKPNISRIGNIRRISIALKKAEKTLERVKIAIGKAKEVFKKTKSKIPKETIKKTKSIISKSTAKKTTIRNLKRADIKRADIKKAGKIQPKKTTIRNLKRADIKKADIKRADIKKAGKIQPKKTTIRNLKRADIKKADIKRADIKKAGKIQPKRMAIRNLKRADIKRADIRKAGKLSIKKANISVKPSELNKYSVASQGLGGAPSTVSTKHRTEIINFGTKNIVPKKTEKVSTGIANLDRITLGGFNKDSVNLVIGETGTAKSILAMQFLIDGINKGEPCLFISFEETKREFYTTMMKLGWDLNDLEKKGKFFFLEYSPGKVKTMLEEGGGIIENLVLSKKILRIAIDSITSFTLLFENEVKKREATLLLFNLLRKWEATTLLTYVGNPTQKLKASSILEFESDSIILLYLLREEKQRNRYLEVFKMRGTEHSNQIYQFEVKKGGINLTNKALIGGID